jgi:DNA invertase Pin-like site-specific DNA recombinase
VYALLGQLSSDESMLNQRASIIKYAKEHSLELESEMLEFDNKTKPLQEREQFYQFVHSLKNEDSIIIDTIDVLGQSMEDVILVINCMLSRGVTLHIASNGVEVTRATGLEKVLPLIVSLQRDPPQKGKKRVGRPKGRRSASKFDVFVSKILARLKEGKSVSAIARELNVSRSSLKDYIDSRGLRQMLDDSWLERTRTNQEAGQNIEMFCTLKRENKKNKS